MKSLEELAFECLYYFGNEIVVVVGVDGGAAVSAAGRPHLVAAVEPQIVTVDDLASDMDSGHSWHHFGPPFAADMDSMAEFPLYYNRYRYTAGESAVKEV